MSIKGISKVTRRWINRWNRKDIFTKDYSNSKLTLLDKRSRFKNQLRNIKKQFLLCKITEREYKSQIKSLKIYFRWFF